MILISSVRQRCSTRGLSFHLAELLIIMENENGAVFGKSWTCNLEGKFSSLLSQNNWSYSSGIKYYLNEI